MNAKGKILIVFPDEWLAYSPSVLNFYKCCSENFRTDIVYFNNIKFRNEGLVENGHPLNVSSSAAWFWRKTFGYKFYKILRLFFLLLRFKLSGKKYDKVVAVDSGYLPAKLVYRNSVYFSLETEKDIYFRCSKKIGIDTLIIQSEERKNYLICPEENVKVFYIQNAPILNGVVAEKRRTSEKNLLYMGNIEFGYGLEQFISAVLSLSGGYSLTLKGIKNEKYFRFLSQNYSAAIESGRLKFDFSYIDQANIVGYVSRFYIGITGYDLELAKKSFNYYSSPAGKLFNYYAAGIPVIGIDIIGLRSVKDFNAGVLIGNVDPGNIQAAIRKIEEGYEVFSENALKAARHFDFRKAFNVYINDGDFGGKGDNAMESSTRLSDCLPKGHERTVKTKQNIVSSFLIKSFSILISFLLIPLAINYLNPVKYGIWLTVTSFVGWFAFFDLGLGNGLRNRLGEALAKNDREMAKVYVSTSYALLALVIAAVYVLFILLHPFLNWSAILNTPAEMNEDISRLMFIVFSFFCLQFIIKHVSMILRAHQRTALSGGINTFASLLSLLIIFALSKSGNGSLYQLSVGVSIANIASPLILSVWLFSGDYRYLFPSFSSVRFSCAKDLMGIGLNFFIVQIASLLLFSTDSLIIAKLFGPEEVTPYNVAFKYFSAITIIFTIITAPMWNAYTDAYHSNDFEWIKRITSKLRRFWMLLFLVACIMLVFSSLFYSFWIGKEMKIPFVLSLCMALWVLMLTWISIYGSFLSGVGKIRLSLYSSLFIIATNIPLSVLFAKHFQMGSAGVVLATCISVLPQVVLFPLQYRRIVNQRDAGIWGK